LAQLVNRGRQVLAVIAGRQVGQVLAGQVYQAGRAIVVQACLVGQVLAGRQVGLAKWGRLERQVGLAFRAGLVLVAIAGQVYLAGLVLVAIADQACLVGQAIRGRKGRQAIAGFRAGLANRGRLGRQVGRASAGSAGSVAIAGQGFLAIVAIQALERLVGQAIQGRKGHQVLAAGLAFLAGQGSVAKMVVVVFRAFMALSMTPPIKLQPAQLQHI